MTVISNEVGDGVWISKIKEDGCSRRGDKDRGGMSSIWSGVKGHELEKIGNGVRTWMHGGN